MKKVLPLILFTFSTIGIFSQENNIIDLNKKWLFGVELGLNTITSYNYNESKKSFQGGFIAEYYFAKKWSVTARLKYFKIGESHGIIYNEYNSTVDLTYYRRFNGEAISLPLNIKWEYRIFQNFRGNLKIGLAFNQETVSEYYYLPDERTDYPTFFIDYNFGIGFSYYFNPQIAVYSEFEYKGLGKDRNDSPTFIAPNSTDNNFINIGVKYSFKK
ncbi:MAG: porin family protein [Urechidicola sp.]|nr:porin family protein [Urechidicola sp.]